MNVSLSSRHSVHAQTPGGSGPACHAFGAPHGSEAYRQTTREVTCKKCLKELAGARIAAQVEAEITETGELAEIVPTPEGAELAAQVEAECGEAVVDRNEKIWTWANTGVKLHAFVQSAGPGKLRAMCRASIERDARGIFQGQDANRTWLCRDCLTKAEAMWDRAEASMEPVGAYDQAREGILPDEDVEPLIIARDEADAIQIRAERQQQRRIDALHAEALAMDEAQTRAVARQMAAYAPVLDELAQAVKNNASSRLAAAESPVAKLAAWVDGVEREANELQFRIETARRGMPVGILVQPITWNGSTLWVARDVPGTWPTSGEALEAHRKARAAS